METIAALVGHSDIETTDDYLHISQQTLREAVVVLNQEVSAQRLSGSNAA